MRKHYTTAGVNPVLTAGGIMPGGSEMTHWYNHISFPDPETLAAKRVELLARIEAEKITKAASDRRHLTVVSDGTDRKVAESEQVRRAA